MSFRSTIPDFQLANPLYTGARVSFYTLDGDGARTDTLATLYAGPIGATTASNPQTLDADGKFTAPVYADEPVIAEIVAANVGTHETGAINTNGTWRGDYAEDEVYYSTDFVTDPDTGDLYVVADHFTATGVLADDVTAGHLELVLDQSVLVAAPLASAVWGPMTDVASAATVDLGATSTVEVNITGSTGISSFGSGTNRFRIVKTAAAVAITAGASLVSPVGSFTTAIGQTFLAYSDASAVWRLVGVGFEHLSGAGFLSRNSSSQFALRSITGTANEITVTNGDGASGAPTLSLPAALTFTGKTVTGGTFSGITLTGLASFSIVDSGFTLQDNGDNTKQVQFQLSGLTTGQTRTLTVQDASGTLALTSNKLSAFAATTSAELAGVISDETGSGALVFATSPTLVTPTLGVASATSINKVALTAPATSATLTIADGKTLTASNTLTFTGTDASSVAFGTGGTVAYQGGTLAQFAATTSAQLAGVISDETGSGALVFGTSPTFTTSMLLASGFVHSWDAGDLTLTHSANTLTLAGGTLVLPDSGLQIGASNPFSDSAGTLTLQNVDALDATTEATIEAAIDTLANLTSIQGRTVTLADAGANAVFGWDDTAGAYENLTASEVRGAIGLATSDSPEFTALNVGHATDTTITRVSAGLIAVEGATVWTSGNDGAGSGLDADLLDGKNTGTSGNVVPLLDGANTWSAQQTITLGSAAATEPLRLVNTTDAASVQAIQIEGDRATMAANDEVYASMLLSDSGGTQTEFARLTAVATDVTDTSEDGQFEIDVQIAGSLTQVAAFSGSGLNLAASDALSFGGVAILSDSAGTTTLSNIDAIDATTESTIEAAIDTLANLTSVQGRTVTLADAGFDAFFGWDDDSGSYKNLLLADIATEGAPAAGDFVLMIGAEGDARKVNWSSLPGAGGGLTNVADDTDPALGGNLDANTFSILFDDNTGILDQNGNETMLFQTVASAVNYWDVFNSATGNGVSLIANGSDTDVAAILSSKGAGSVHLAINGTNEVTLTGSALSPATSDGNALGTGSLMWADLFLASGGVINFNNGDVNLTHSANTLAFTGASSGYTFDAVTLPASNDGAALGSTSVGWSDLHLATGGVINWANGEASITETDANTLTVAGVTTFDLGAADVKMGDVLTMDEHASSPSTPASGKVVIYAKTDGLIYGKDDAGTETQLSNASSSGPTLVTTLNGASGTPATLSVTGLAGYNRVWAVFEGLSPSSNGVLRVAASTNNGSSYGTVASVTGSQDAASTYYGMVELVGLAFGYMNFRFNGVASLVPTTSSSGTQGVSSSVTGGGFIFAAGTAIDALQFSPAAGTFDAGTIKIYAQG